MLRFGTWMAGGALALMLIAPVQAEDTKQERKELDTLEGYQQLPGEKGIKKDLTDLPNQPVETVIIWSEAKPASGAAPLAVTFTADPPASLSNPAYAWQFGDGATGSGASVSHTFTKPGIYKVLLKVTDASGALGLDELRIKVTK